MSEYTRVELFWERSERELVRERSWIVWWPQAGITSCGTECTPVQDGCRHNTGTLSSWEQAPGGTCWREQAEEGTQLTGSGAVHVHQQKHMQGRCGEVLRQPCRSALVARGCGSRGRGYGDSIITSSDGCERPNNYTRPSGEVSQPPGRNLSRTVETLSKGWKSDAMSLWTPAPSLARASLYSSIEELIWRLGTMAMLATRKAVK